MAAGTYEVTHQKILESGRRMFLKNGYQRTNLRELCKGAGITTGAFYRHFKDKEALFGALVEPVMEGIYAMYGEAEEECFEDIGEGNVQHTFQIVDHTIASFVQYMYANFDSFKLLLECSDGTKYKSFLDDLVELEVKNTIRMEEELKKQEIVMNKLTKRQMYRLCHTYFSCIFESVLHDYTEEEAMEDLDTIVDFFTAGWRKVLGLVK